MARTTARVVAARALVALRASAALLLACAGLGAAAQSTPREGTDYTIVQPAQGTDAPAGKVRVIEFFGYWCPACHVFEPTLHDWVARNDAKVSVTYVPMPTHFRAGQADLQKLFYALDAMGRESELRPKIFAAIHAERTLRDSAGADTIATWVAAHGVDRKAFVDVFNSFGVQSKVNRANQMASAYGVTATPSLGIGGKYVVVVDARTLGNADALLARAVAGK